MAAYLARKIIRCGVYPKERELCVTSGYCREGGGTREEVRVYDAGVTSGAGFRTMPWHDSLRVVPA
jgi:hypothetical protein